MYYSGKAYIVNILAMVFVDIQWRECSIWLRDNRLCHNSSRCHRNQELNHRDNLEKKKIIHTIQKKEWLKSYKNSWNKNDKTRQINVGWRFNYPLNSGQWWQVGFLCPQQELQTYSSYCLWSLDNHHRWCQCWHHPEKDLFLWKVPHYLQWSEGSLASGKPPRLLK